MTASRSYRYYDLVMVAFVTVLVCSNLIGPAKISQLDMPLLGTLTFGAGVSQIFIFNLCNALVQTFSPNELRGRIMGVYTFVFFGAMPIAALGIGATAQRLGEPAAVIIGASIMLLAAGLVWIFFPRLRHQS